MATGYTNNHEIEESSTIQDSYFESPSCKIQELACIYINREESNSIDVESARFQSDLNCETPNKHPNAPHSSPIDLQNDPDDSVFNEELVKCLNKLPVILLSLEERRKDGSTEILEFDAEDSEKSYLEASTFSESEMKLVDSKEFQYCYENVKKTVPVIKMARLADDDKSEPTDPFATNGTNRMEKFNLLRVDSLGEFSTDFHRSTLSDNTSIIANCASDTSMDDVESELSDDNSSSAFRDRIEFEALALDSAIHPFTIQKLQNWRARGRNKRALSLDEMNPLKMLHTTDFSAPSFELTI